MTIPKLEYDVTIRARNDFNDLFTYKVFKVKFINPCENDEVIQISGSSYEETFTLDNDEEGSIDSLSG